MKVDIMRMQITQKQENEQIEENKLKIIEKSEMRGRRKMKYKKIRDEKRQNRRRQRKKCEENIRIKLKKTR